MKFNRIKTKDVLVWLRATSKAFFIFTLIFGWVASMHYMGIVVENYEFLGEEFKMLIMAIQMLIMAIVFTVVCDIVQYDYNKKNKKNAGDRFGKN